MEEKKKGSARVSKPEIDLLEKLRSHPRILARLQRILGIVGDEDSAKSADQIEGLVIEEMRQLGSATIEEWAIQAEKKAGQELQSKDPTVLKRKKKR